MTQKGTERWKGHLSQLASVMTSLSTHRSIAAVQGRAHRNHRRSQLFLCHPHKCSITPLWIRAGTHLKGQGYQPKGRIGGKKQKNMQRYKILQLNEACWHRHGATPPCSPLLQHPFILILSLHPGARQEISPSPTSKFIRDVKGEG